jgi:CxxC motif-containing protein
MKEQQDKLICIMCPVGCELTVTHIGKNVISVKGNGCPLGEKFAKEEFNNPKRVIITTVQVENGTRLLVPVRSDKPVPKEKLFEILQYLRKVKVRAPVKFHQVIVENIAGTDANIVATFPIEKEETKT